MAKRKSTRAIVFTDDMLMAMYREKEGKVYYTFPGGGIDEGETEEQCVVRECFEEFGVNVKPVKKVYVYSDEDKQIDQAFYICEWISGNFGEGEGEEFQEGRVGGVYIPSLIKIDNIPNLPLMPPQVTAQLVEDYKKNGKALRNDIKEFIVGK